jgi:PAS domain S-box-containing protein
MGAGGRVENFSERVGRKRFTRPPGRSVKKELVMKTGDQKELQFIETTEDKRYAKELEQAYAEIKRLKSEIHKIETHNRAILENAPDAFFLLDARSGRFIDCNKKAIEMLGWPREKILTFTPVDISTPISRDGRPAADGVRETLDSLTSGDPMVFEWDHVHADGRVIISEVRVQLLPSIKPPTLCGIISDITARKKNEEELKKAFAKIEDLSERLKQENILLRKELEKLHAHEEIVGESQAILAVLKQAEQVAGQDTSVLIQGETGTGKELIARSIHRMSSRMTKPLITVHCGALPPTLIEGELFGREKGAYTGALTQQAGRFEIADQATIFLDEIGDLPLDMQAKLLRVIQEGQFERLGSTKTITVDVRVIAATNHDLEQAKREGRFRRDLYYRLSVFPITVPPLRERKEDIPLLVWTFVREYEKKMGKRVEKITQKSMDMRPGNVRELRSVIERAMVLHTGNSLHMDPILGKLETTGQPVSLEEVARDHILHVLNDAGWKISGKGGAAEKLGLKESTLRAKMGRLGIRRPG